MVDFEEVMHRRQLTDGHWDKRLKRRMLRLSEADNYDDAKHEWRMTGDCWYIPFGDDAGIVLPDNHRGNNHSHECLCGHPIVWHFEIENTETDITEIVGSEHIESYMVLRHFEEQGIDPATVTDETIEEWITEKVKSMKCDWWWKLHGDQFVEWFEEIRELDLRVNVRQVSKSWSQQTRRYEPVMKIRKRAEEKFGTPGYKMASVVWRWNHPDNTRRQIESRGYPNERLWNDLQMFYITQQQYRQQVIQEETELNDRLGQLADQDRLAERQRKQRMEETQKRREAHLKRQEEHAIVEAELDGVREENRLERAIAARMNADQTEQKFAEMCEYYDIPVFSPDMAQDSWGNRFLTDMVYRLSGGKSLSKRQLASLRNIVVDEPLPASSKQIWYIKKLAGDDFQMPENLDRKEASDLISRLKGEEE